MKAAATSGPIGNIPTSLPMARSNDTYKTQSFQLTAEQDQIAAALQDAETLDARSQARAGPSARARGA